MTKLKIIIEHSDLVDTYPDFKALVVAKDIIQKFKRNELTEFKISQEIMFDAFRVLVKNGWINYRQIEFVFNDYFTEDDGSFLDDFRPITMDSNGRYHENYDMFPYAMDLVRELI